MLRVEVCLGGCGWLLCRKQKSSVHINCIFRRTKHLGPMWVTFTCRGFSNKCLLLFDFYINLIREEVKKNLFFWNKLSRKKKFRLLFVIQMLHIDLNFLSCNFTRESSIINFPVQSQDNNSSIFFRKYIYFLDKYQPTTAMSLRKFMGKWKHDGYLPPYPKLLPLPHGHVWKKINWCPHAFGRCYKTLGSPYGQRVGDMLESCFNPICHSQFPLSCQLCFKFHKSWLLSFCFIVQFPLASLLSLCSTMFQLNDESRIRSTIIYIYRWLFIFAFLVQTYLVSMSSKLLFTSVTWMTF